MNGWKEIKEIKEEKEHRKRNETWLHTLFIFLRNCFLALDAVKRRTLPAWIREGLEKMDREKQKKVERERMEKERAEMANDDSKGHEVDNQGDGPHVPRKSKFVSIFFTNLA